MAHDFSGKVALVTGAGSGIGRATALAFARAGADLAVCDVHEERLAAAADEARAMGRTVLARRVDVADRDAMRAFADEVHKERAAVDVLVNNAGVGMDGGLLETSLDDWDWILGINLRGVIHGCHFFVPPMVKRGAGGHVVNISSASGFFAWKELSAYSTTKFAVFGLSESLRAELAPHGIGVSTICPGAVNTDIVNTSVARGRLKQPGERERDAKLFQTRGYPPEKVASIVLDAVARRRGVVPITPEAWGLYLLKRFAPDAAPAIFETIVAGLRRFG